MALVSEDSNFKILQQCLSIDEITKISENVCQKLESFFQSKFDEYISAKALFETNRTTLDKKLNQLINDFKNSQEKLIDYEQKLDLAKKYSSELQDQLSSSRNEMHQLQESIKRLEKDNLVIRRQKNELIDENNSLHSNLERKDTELERLRTEIVSLGSQLQIAIATKCQALAEIEEAQSREINIDFREKRVEQERILFTQQVSSLEEELSKRTIELQNVRSEFSARNLLIQTRLSQCEEELKIANDSVADIREANSSLQRRHQELAQKLEDQRNHELSMHSSYREEIMAQTRLADLYKGMADEANAKIDDYNNAVKELQELLEHATEQYGILEANHNKLVLVNENDRINKEKKIEQLNKELEDANELLETFKQERLDQAVEQLAPTAAIANRILKKGLSLTQIYTQFVEVSNELSLEKSNNEKLKSQMDIILRELEEKAPILQKQRENYEVAVANVTALTLRIDELLIENSRLQESTSEADRLVNHFTKENEKLKLELADLARQVCYLLKEVEENRIGESIPMSEVSSMGNNELASSQIISKQLVTFRDIESLQENNQKLLSIVRILSSRQEEIEKATEEINSGEMKEKLERYIEQLNGMQAAQTRQTKMLESILKQRDMYKKMYQQCINQASGVNREDEPTSEKYSDRIEKSNCNTSTNIPNSSDRNMTYNEKSRDFEIQFNRLSNDFETYKQEKTAHENMLNNEVERLRKEAENNSTRCCRLKAQLDSANERFTIVQGNIATYKSQIKVLEDKCNSYNLTIGKHEQSLMILKDEALSAQSRLSKAEVQVENLKQERQLLRDSESRLLKEREVFQRERHTHALLKADVEAIKTSLERVQVEQQLRTEQRLDDATRECAALRRRLQEEQDRFRELSTNLERQVNAAQERILEEKNLNKQIQADLDIARQSEQKCIKKIEELNNKLKETASIIVHKPIFTGDEGLSKRLKELEAQLTSSQSETKSLTDQLKAARFQGQQYCDIAESTETQLREMTEQFNKLEKKHDLSLKRSEEEISTLKRTIKSLEENASKLSEGCHDSDFQLKTRLVNAEKKVELFDEIKIQLEQVKSELQTAVIAASVAEDKYAREMVLHSADLQTLTKLKEENQIITAELAELMQKHNSIKETLEIQKSMWQEREQRYINEIEESGKRIEDLDAQNILLHNQIQDLSGRTAMLHSQNSSTSDLNSSMNLESISRSFDDEDQKSMEQLLQVMKYLRREKDLAIAKFDVLKSENSRLKAQIDLSEKRLEEFKKLIDRDRENNEIDVLTVSKHSELLRKVETLNAITDSNRVLREERDLLNNKIKEFTSKLKQLSEEIIPLREKVSDLEAKNDTLMQENNSLKNEVQRWRQRANTLVERSNKASPEDWRRLQTERENLSKLLTSEREVHAKRLEEMNNLKIEKSLLEDQCSQIQKQIQSKEETISQISNEKQILANDLNKVTSNFNEKVKELENLKKELTEKDVFLADVRNKEIQIRKIAKKYKTQYEELSKTLGEEKIRIDNQNSQGIGQKQMIEDDSQFVLERESQLREEGRSEFRQANHELNLKVEELSRQVTTMQSESENLKKEIELIHKASLEKEEKAKQVLKGARTKIMQLTEYKKYCEKEVNELKEKLESSTTEIESNTNEYEARIAALKSQMEGRISRLEHERSDLQAEKESLMQRATQLQRQLTGQGNPNTGVSEPPTANIKPMSARAETPLASIRPMSVVVQSRTAAVLPTTAASPLILTAQQSSQQLVHTTETSSPTSSHIDYQPASTSRQHLIQPQLNESAESTLREEPEVDQQQQQACAQQTVALVSPRIEQQQQQSLPNDQQTVPSSSTQSVTTSHPSSGLKRPRTLDSTGSNLNENGDHSRQEQLSSPKTKRSRQPELTSASGNTSDIEYQVPTSSQRDQDEETEDNCIVVVDCDEGNETHQNTEEEFENDTYEEIEDEEEELPYGIEVEGDNNEVEIILGRDSANNEIPRQIQSELQTNQQQQSEAISSVGVSEPTFVSRSTRNTGSGHRQHPQQHLLLPQQGYEDGGDDCIVPSTPTLFVPRRNDGFGEAVSSPQIPQNRFTFGESSSSVPASASQTHSTNTISGSRTIFSSTPSGLAQVVQEGMDDTRIDLTQLDDSSTGRSVPSTPRQVSPNTDHQESANINSPGEHNNMIDDSLGPQMTERLTHDENSTVNPRVDTELGRAEVVEQRSDNIDDSNIPERRTSESILDNVNNTDAGQLEEAPSDVIENECKDENREAEASPSNNTRQRTTMTSTSNTSLSRGATARRSTRTSFRTVHGNRPTPIVWDNQSSRGPISNRGHSSRSSSNENTRTRGTRGRRLRSKYPYNY